MTTTSGLADRSRTAMRRSFVSRPVRLALEDQVIRPDTTVFDYGCGRGDDIRYLGGLGFTAAGWDPAHAAEAPVHEADVVNLGYVVNVIDDHTERRETLLKAWKLARKTLVVSARLQWEASQVSGGRHGDGVRTSKGTFQKFFTQEELRAWVEGTLGTQAIAAAPGVFFVFKHEREEQGYLARRSRTQHGTTVRIADVLYEQHRDDLDALRVFVEEHRRLPAGDEFADSSGLVEAFGSVRAAFAVVRRVTGAARWRDIEVSRERMSERRFAQHEHVLQPMLDFLSARGRLPRQEELPGVDALESEFGSIRAAFALVRRVTGADRWEAIEQAARTDFLVYLALAAFGGRPRFSDLPADLQHDVRDFFGTYRAACDEADRLLYGAGDPSELEAAVRSSSVGKLTPEAIYVHVSSLGDLPPVLRVYEGCARALAGDVDGASVLKLHRIKKQVSYLVYPQFERDPHPALESVVIARLAKLDVTHRDFRDSANPPVLHRKETFVSPEHPAHERFRRLTAQEDRAGLLDDASTIGTRSGWEERLRDRGYTLRGHRLVRAG